MQPRTILDTDVLSGLIRRVPKAVARAGAYLADHPLLPISIITRFEILRGLKAARATKRLVAFNAFFSACEILPISEQTIDLASDLFGDLYRRGQLIPDADLLIAATALEHGCVLATNNISDFSRINGLVIDNWLQ